MQSSSGRLKARIYPEDVTLNMSKHAKVPPVPDLGDGIKHKWGGVEHKNTVTWLAKWKDSINGEDKSVWLSANSSWKGMSDKAKYEKARTLKEHIGKVRTDYMQGMRSGDIEAQQKSVAVYLIDRCGPPTPCLAATAPGPLPLRHGRRRHRHRHRHGLHGLHRHQRHQRQRQRQRVSVPRVRACPRPLVPLRLVFSGLCLCLLP